jgi:cell division transport system permease protein
MRLVGATRAYVKGPFVTEGVLQGGLGGLAAWLLLWAALEWLSRDLARSDILPHTALALPPVIGALLVALGMVVGLAGSLMSLSRLEV